MTVLCIYCAGGFGREVMDVARRVNAAQGLWSEIRFVDDVCETPTRYGAQVSSFAAFSGAPPHEPAEFLIASGEPAARAMLRERVAAGGFAFAQLVDTSTVRSDSARLGAGVIVTPLCSLSSDAQLGENACVNTMAIVGHDVLVGCDSVISSMVNLGGRCVVGERSYVGMGALVKEGVRIGNDSIVGMGAVVYTDIPDGVIALGNPARPMRPNEDKRVFK
ncbi:MAG: NeuD/PglB/VioB family sugar acetyltransferase [Rhodoferax sp.]